MRRMYVLLIAALFSIQAASAQWKFNRFDTTLKIARAGYRFHCKNDRLDQNSVMIRPIGFNSEAREMNFAIRGLVRSVEIDDLNADGYPDLLVYIFTDTSRWVGTVYAFISDGNKSIVPCLLPDVMLDGKVNSQYKGHDQFSRMEGYLLQKFPIYQPGDDLEKPTGGTRVLLYQLVKNPDGGFKFDRVRSYDTH